MHVYLCCEVSLRGNLAPVCATVAYIHSLGYKMSQFLLSVICKNNAK